LFAFAGFQDDHEWIEGYFLLLFSHQGFQLLREQGRDDFVIGVTSAQLEKPGERRDVPSFRG